MHGGNMGMGDAFGTGSYGMNFCLPRLDQALSALLTDLKDRGMLDDTLVVAVGEFGRTPIILTQGPPGRQHWPQCFSAIVAGCGNFRGRLISDGREGEQIRLARALPVRPQAGDEHVLSGLRPELQDHVFLQFAFSELAPFETMSFHVLIERIRDDQSV
jgi:hypothetical protein